MILPFYISLPCRHNAENGQRGNIQAIKLKINNLNDKSIPYQIKHSFTMCVFFFLHFCKVIAIMQLACASSLLMTANHKLITTLIKVNLWFWNQTPRWGLDSERGVGILTSPRLVVTVLEFCPVDKRGSDCVLCLRVKLHFRVSSLLVGPGSRGTPWGLHSSAG